MVFDLVSAAKQHKAELWDFYLNLPSWKQFQLSHPLKWESVPFSEPNKALVPKVRGLYVFSMTLPDHNLPPHGYMMYAGISGHTGKSHLRIRYGQYLKEPKSSRARPSVSMLMANWKDALTFNFASVPDETVNLKTIETAFLDAVRPPMNQQDFSASVSKAKRAAFS